ncbi:hypothetical protein BSG8_12320 [Bacillus subtilis subsp. natto]|nr:hypothetical protein LJC78_06690 [Bacillus subtilis subsp. natto]BDB92480.1 hypothetical protein BSG8_12320 [Bacillus subtilis subsp. natto]BEH05253.1 hypothetical protein BSNN_12860 [Bacillus subtilis subsp. natto]
MKYSIVGISDNQKYCNSFTLYGEVNGMENNMLQAILDEIKKIDNKIDGVSSELKSFKKEMN